MLSVVEGEGFFVGTGPQDQTYVEFGGAVGENEQGEVPQVGDRVDLAGPVRPSPEDPAQTLNLPAAPATAVREQGAYVNADRVTVR